MSDSFRFEPYDWAGGREWMLVRGSNVGRHIVLIPPLFEEMNFTRTLLAQIGRSLAQHALATWLPDFPGAGESERSLVSIGWGDWRDAARAAGNAVNALTGTKPLTCAFRGGALLDDAVEAAGRWRYAPVAGEVLLRQLRRTQLVADREAGTAAGEDGAVIELAGYPLSIPLRNGLAAAEPATIADREIVASPERGPWRRAQPAGDPELAEQLADDIYQWASACAS